VTAPFLINNIFGTIGTGFSGADGFGLVDALAAVEFIRPVSKPAP